MFCTKCGAQNADGATFCNSCGAPIGVKPAAPAQPAQPQVQYQQPVQPQAQYQQPVQPQMQYQQPVQPQMQYQQPAQPQMQYQQPAQPQTQYQQPMQPQGQYYGQPQYGTKPLFGMPFLGYESPYHNIAVMQKLAKLLLVIGSLVTFISVFLPFCNVSAEVSFWGESESYGEAYNLFGLEGKFVFFAIVIMLCSIVGIVFPLILQGRLQKWATISAGVGLLFDIIALICANSDLNSGMGELDELGLSSYLDTSASISPHIAFFFILIGCIAALVGGIIAFVKRV